MGRGFPLALLLLAGCYWSPHRNHPPGPHGPACADIHAVVQVESIVDAAAALRKIAERPALGAHEQMYLVDAALSLGFSPEIADVLVALVKNPDLFPEARYHLSVRMEGIPFTPDKKRIIDAIVETPSRTK